MIRMKIKLLVVMLGVLLTLTACNEDSASDPAGGSEATVVITPSPAAIGAPWTLDGPGGYTSNGTGETTLADLAPGAYVLTWGAVDGWRTPPGETQTVAAGARVTYRGIYVQGSGPGAIVVDHRAVLDFDAGHIPERWIDEVKSQGILIHFPGRSHAQQLVGDLDGDPVRHVGGLKTLESMDPQYAVAIQCDLADLPASGALRILKGQYDPDDGNLIETWECRFDDAEYWARESGRTVTEFTAAYAGQQGSPITASIFGWSYHLIAPGKVHDENGDGITFNDERRAAYLDAVERFQDHASGTIFVYATAPIDRGYSGNDDYLTGDGLRSTVYNQDFRTAALAAGGYLFDQADIENWSEDFTERRADTHDGQDLQLRHADWDGSDCAHGGMGICVAKAKAIWWMAARLAGWDGTPATP